MSVKFLIGGSPCTKWSIAQKNGRETEAEGEGWELFKNFLIAKEKFQPDFFLYENNKSAAKPIKDQISNELKVSLQYINSALVSAQNRERFYGHNVPNVPQPEDRGILLKDILETNTSEIGYEFNAYGVGYRGRKTFTENWNKQYEARNDGKANALTTAQTDSMAAESIRIGSISTNSQAHRVYSPNGKSVNLVANGGGQGAKTGLYLCPIECYELDNEYYKGGFNGNLIGQIVNNGKYKNGKQPSQQYRVFSSEGKSVCVDQDKRKQYICPIKTLSDGEMEYMVRDPERFKYGYIQNADNDKAKCITANIHKGVPYNVMIARADGTLTPIYEVKNGLITVKDKQYPINLSDGYYVIRKLTVTECCRLQTLPDDYCRAVSNSQAYKGLGNGWTAEVIIHILKHANIPLDEEIVVLSMYDGIGTGRYCFDKMGYKNVKYFATEIDKYPMQIAMSNYPDIIQLGDAFQVRNSDWKLI